MGRLPLGILGAALAAASFIGSDPYPMGGVSLGSGSRGQKVARPANPAKKAKRKAQARARATTKSRRAG